MTKMIEGFPLEPRKSRGGTRGNEKLYAKNEEATVRKCKFGNSDIRAINACVKVLLPEKWRLISTNRAISVLSSVVAKKIVTGEIKKHEPLFTVLSNRMEPQTDKRGEAIRRRAERRNKSSSESV